MRPLQRALVVSCLIFAPLLGVALAAAPSDRAATEGALAELEKDPATKDSTAEAVKKSRAALERATRMRAAGDEAHAKLAEGLAHDWAEVGKEVRRAALAEKQAADMHQSALDASAQTDRERSMLEQRVAENGRLVAELGAMDAGKAVAASSDAGAKKASTPTRDGGR